MCVLTFTRSSDNYLLEGTQKTTPDGEIHTRDFNKQMNRVSALKGDRERMRASGNETESEREKREQTAGGLPLNSGSPWAHWTNDLQES